MSPAIHWFRRDLRLRDNPALAAAAAAGPVIPIFIWAPEEDAPWEPGAASRWWLHHSLAALDAELRKLGSSLVILRGPSLEMLHQVISQTGATSLHWNRLYEPYSIRRDAAIKETFTRDGFTVSSHNAALLIEPWEILNSSKKPFQVFTPYWRALRGRYENVAPLSVPKLASENLPSGISLDSLGLLPQIPWDRGFYDAWRPGEGGAAREFERFIDEGLRTYRTDRDRPDRTGTSRLSPHLHFGEIGPRQIWHEIDSAMRTKRGALSLESTETYLKEIAWREFAHHLLFHFPRTPAEPLREQFKKFRWENDPKGLRAWQRGMTGFPIVDAGMRELWATGWMHNRVRMIAGSFLVKDLRISWTEGARWFWDTLVDADLANNTLGWQWVSGCGADAAPYFRVFNPALQEEKFDPEGEYVRRWIPELRGAKSAYPVPIVDHAEARELALEAYSNLKR